MAVLRIANFYKAHGKHVGKAMKLCCNGDAPAVGVFKITPS
jgi:hypothetical protein